MKKRPFLFTAIIAMLFAVTPVSAALFQNGSFETGTNPPGSGFRTLSAGNPDLFGWTIGDNSIDWIGSYWTPVQGSRSIDLAGNGKGSISQTFDTEAGKDYRITFAMSGNPDGGDKFKDLLVTVGSDITRSFSFDTTGKTISNMGWVPNSFVFKAVGSRTEFQFESLEGKSPYGPALDNIRVDAVPIPAAAWLLGSGLIELVVVRRRFNK